MCIKSPLKTLLRIHLSHKGFELSPPTQFSSAAQQSWKSNLSEILISVPFLLSGSFHSPPSLRASLYHKVFIYPNGLPWSCQPDALCKNHDWNLIPKCVQAQFRLEPWYIGRMGHFLVLGEPLFALWGCLMCTDAGNGVGGKLNPLQPNRIRLPHACKLSFKHKTPRTRLSKGPWETWRLYSIW